MYSIFQFSQVSRYHGTQPVVGKSDESIALHKTLVFILRKVKVLL